MVQTARFQIDSPESRLEPVGVLLIRLKPRLRCWNGHVRLNHASTARSWWMCSCSKERAVPSRLGRRHRFTYPCSLMPFASSRASFGARSSPGAGMVAASACLRRWSGVAPAPTTSPGMGLPGRNGEHLGRFHQKRGEQRVGHVGNVSRGHVANVPYTAGPAPYFWCNPLGTGNLGCDGTNRTILPAT